MPFSTKFMQLFNRVKISPPSDFRKYAKTILEEDSSIINQTDVITGANTLLFTVMSLYEKREKRGNKNFENDMHMSWMEENITILIGLLLEKGANPNISWSGNVNITATDYFIKFLALHLCLTGIDANNPQILLDPYKSLIAQFVKQKAEFRVNQLKDGKVQVILHTYIADVVRSSLQLQLSKQVQPPTLRF